MTTAVIPDWTKVHDQAPVVDLHTHPSLKALLFRRGMTGRLWQPAGIRGEMNPLSVRTSLEKLQDGGVDVLLYGHTRRRLWPQSQSVQPGGLGDRGSAGTAAWSG